MTAALLSFAPAALLGWWEWLTIPSSHEARRPATNHGLINTAAGVLVLAGLWRPRRAEALGAAIALMAVAAWIGGDLVYRLGWRVRKAELYEQLEEGKSFAEAERVVREHERVETLIA
jgi:membrane protein DedA with SNARE-associated domain